MRTLIPALACLALTGCSLNFTRPIPVEHAVVELESGVVYEDELSGVGDAADAGDELTVHYEAWLEDGQPVDSSVERGIPITFVLGEAPIAGWNDGLSGMREGGTRHLTVPAPLAYGAEGVPGLVPPDAPLSFRIQLIEVAGDDDELETPAGAPVEAAEAPPELDPPAEVEPPAAE